METVSGDGGSQTSAPAGARGASGTFANPDAAHSPAAYWFWHTVPTQAEIVTQIAEMKAGGYLSFQIQARLAFPRGEYLGQAYLEACAAAVSEASNQGMTVGIYDDYNWQSGHAGGRTVAGRDELRERHVFWASERSRTAPRAVTKGPASGQKEPLGAGSASITLRIDDIVSSTESLGTAGMEWQYDGGVCAWDEWTVVAVLAQPTAAPARHVDLTAVARISAADEKSCAVTVDLPDDLDPSVVVTAFVSARAATSFIPNYLLRESAERFIEVGYEPYARALVPHLGTTVEYVFFDQPHATFYSWAQQVGNLRSSMLWSDELPTAFDADHHADFASALLALVHDVGAQTARLRMAFWDTYSRLAQRNFLGVLADWCHAHDLRLTGHEVLGHVGGWHLSKAEAFETWDLRANFAMDYFGLDAYRDLTAVDAQDCVPQLSAKLGDSVARSNGRSGCIVEQYILGDWLDSYPGDWDVTLQDIRAQAIRLHLAGARQFLFHAFYQTDGTTDNTDFFSNPRFDFAPGINFEPWWAFHRAFADESARLSTFVDDAEPACDVAILYPLRTAWSEGPGHSYGDHVAFWASYLAEVGFGYHFIDERDLLRASASGGKLRIGGREYLGVVLPSIASVHSVETVALLRRFSESGGILVASGDTPQSSQDGSGESVVAAWRELVDVSHSQLVLDGIPDPELVRPFLGPLRSRHPHLRGAAGPIWQWAGLDRESTWRLAVFNDSQTRVTVSLETPWHSIEIQRWDAAEADIGSWTHVPTATSASPELRLEPMELRCFRVREAGFASEPVEGPPGDAIHGEGVSEERLSTGDDPRAPERIRDAVLADSWSLEVSEPVGAATTTRPIAVDRGWEQQGLPAHSGVGVYRRAISVPLDPSAHWSLVLPAVHSAVEVRVDGVLIGRRAWAPYEFPLPAELLEEANHTLELHVYNSAGNGYLAGTPFRATPAPSGLSAPPVLRRTEPSDTKLPSDSKGS